VGVFTIRLEVGDPEGQHFESFDALVDTGSTNTALPASILRRLSVVPYRKDSFELADGREVELEVGRARVQVNSRQELTQVVFADEGTEPILGMVTLEEAGLSIDPVRQILVPVAKKRM